MVYSEMWEIEVRHEGLNKYRHIRGSDRRLVEKKASVQYSTWDEMWSKKQVAEKKSVNERMPLETKKKRRS